MSPNGNGAMLERPPLRDDHGQPIEDDQGFLLPTHRTFASVWNSISKTYPYRWDEALKHSSQNALCMVRDAFLMGCLFERIYQLAELGYHLEPENAKDERQVEETRQLTNIVKATDRWIQFCTQIGWATWYGRYANQILWKAKEVDGVPRLCATKHAPVNGDKIQFGWDGTPRVMVGYHWIAQHAPPGSKWANAQYFENYPERDALINSSPAAPTIYADRAPMLILRDPLWRERFVIHKHMCIDADYFDGEMAGGVHGVGLRSQIYWFFWLRDEMIGWAVNHLKKIGVGGILIFYFDENNANSKTAAENAAKNAGERYAIAMPRPRGSSRDVEGAQLLPFNEAGVQSLTQVVQDYFERHIERLIIGQSLSSKAEATGLGSAVAGLHADTKYKILKFDADNLADTLSDDFVRVIQKWNFPHAKYRVKFVFDVPDPGADGKIGLATQLFATGMALKADNLRSLAGFEKPEQGDETVSQAQLAEQQAKIQGEMAMQQAQQQQQMQAEQMQQQQQAEAQKMAAQSQQQMQGKQQDQEHQLKVAQQSQQHELAKLQKQQELAIQQEQHKQEAAQKQAVEQHDRALEMERVKNPLAAPPEPEPQEEPEPDRSEILQVIEQVLGPDWMESDESPAERLGLGGPMVDEIIGPEPQQDQQDLGDQSAGAQAVPERQSGDQPVAGPPVVGFAEDGSLIEYKAEHAPAGGVTINGKEFVGGQFIPAGDMAKASPQERANLEAKKRGQPAQQPAAQPSQPPTEQPQAEPEAAPTAEGPAQAEPGQEAQGLESLVPSEHAPVIPPEQTQSLMTEASQRVPPEHQVHVFHAIQRFSQLPTHDYVRAAGRAYQGASKAQALGQVTQDVYDAAACKLIDKYRWQRFRVMGKKAEIPPVSKGVMDLTKYIKKKVRRHGSRPIADTIRQQTSPLIGTDQASVEAAIQANPQDQDAILHRARMKRRIQEVGVDIARDAIIAFIQLGVGQIPKLFSKASGHPMPQGKGYSEDDPPVYYAMASDAPLPDPRESDLERLAVQQILAEQKVDATPAELDDMMVVLDELFGGENPVARPVAQVT